MQRHGKDSLYLGIRPDRIQNRPDRIQNRLRDIYNRRPEYHLVWSDLTIQIGKSSLMLNIPL
jgi:hypothetical protein